MIKNPKLYAVVSHPAKPTAPIRKRSIAEIRTEKLSEFKTKKAADRIDAVLSRLEVKKATIAKQIAALQARKALAVARIERIEERVLTLMTAAKLDRVDGFHIVLSKKLNPPSLSVEDVSQVPPEFLIPQPDKIDTNALKKFILAGADIDGCRVTQGTSLVRK